MKRVFLSKKLLLWNLNWNWWQFLTFCCGLVHSNESIYTSMVCYSTRGNVISSFRPTYYQQELDGLLGPQSLLLLSHFRLDFLFFIYYLLSFYSLHFHSFTLFFHSFFLATDKDLGVNLRILLHELKLKWKLLFTFW